MDKKENMEEAIRMVLGLKHNLIKENTEPNVEVIKYVEQMSAFIILAHCLNLKRLYNNIYEDESGAHFVQTKYGFQPQESFDKGIALREIHKQVHHLESIIKENKDEINSLNESRDTLKNTVSDLKKQIEELKSKNSKANAELNELKTSLKKNQSRDATLLEENHQLNLKIFDLTEQTISEKEQSDSDRELLKTLVHDVSKDDMLVIIRKQYDKEFNAIISGIKRTLDNRNMHEIRKLNKMQQYLLRLQKLQYVFRY